MGFYASWVLPRLLDLTMRQERLVPYRQRRLAATHGRVLEIGVGSGLNLPMYGPAVDGVYGIDPSPQLLAFAKSRKRLALRRVVLTSAMGEALPFASASFDCVLTTWTLCSIPEPVAALAEMRRVLRPEGQLHFVEHGRSPDPAVERWQDRLTPCWARASGGCHLNRKVDDLIRAAGFHIDHLQTGYMKGPKLMTFMYEGTARSHSSSP